MHEKKKIPLWHYKQFSNNMCPKCLNAASKAIIVSFSTSSQVFLVNIHKSKSMRSTETSKEKNGLDWRREWLGHGAQRTRLAWEIKRTRCGLRKSSKGKKKKEKRKTKEVGKNQ